MRFFVIESKHPGRLKKQIWVKKNTAAAWAKCGKTPTTVA